MKKLTCLMIVLGLCLCRVNAENRWDISGIINLNFSGTRVSDNWAGGETDLSNWIIQGDAAAALKEAGYSWENYLKLEYGESSLDGEAARITADRVFLESLILYMVSRYGNPYAAFSAETFFNDFFDPGTLTESLGLGWILIDTENHSLDTRAGAAFKQTLSAAAGTECETGAEWVTGYRAVINEMLRLESRLNVFTAFDGVGDMRWDNSLYFRLTDYISARIGYLAVHNNNPAAGQSGEVQTRLNFGLGISYNIF